MSVLDDLKAAYPNRYYADYNKPCAWYDMLIHSSTPGLSAADRLFPLTREQWHDKGGHTHSQLMYVDNGALVAYTPAVTPQTLAQQATTVLATQKTYVTNTYLVYGETVPDAWTTYLKALRAISDGTDTTSTVLPTSPLDAAPVVLTEPQKTALALQALGAYLLEEQSKGFFFTPTGTDVAILFSTSSHAQSQYTGANSLAVQEPNTPQNFIPTSGAPIVLSAADVIKLTNGVASYINATNAAYATLVAKVEADYTTDITQGWPDNKL